MYMRLLLTLVVVGQPGCPAPGVGAKGPAGSHSDNTPAYVTLVDASPDVAATTGGPSDDAAVDGDVDTADASSSPPDKPTQDVIPRACCNALAQEACAAPDPRCTRLAQAASACFDGLSRAGARRTVLDTLRKALAPAPLPDACR